MSYQKDVLIKIVLDSWNNQLKQVDKLLEELSDDQLAREIAPNRNSGVYILGHLVAVHDAMLPLLGFGEKLHPELAEIFLHNPDKSPLQKPSTVQLRIYWTKVNTLLTSKPAALSTIEQWFERHTSVSEEDFIKEPHRNKLNVVVGRTNHLAYHIGQLVLLKKQ